MASALMDNDKINLSNNDTGQHGLPRISLVIPSLNAEDCIEGLLLKLLSQTRVPDEILVVDSSSTDSTAEIVRQMSEANRCI